MGTMSSVAPWQMYESAHVFIFRCSPCSMASLKCCQPWLKHWYIKVSARDDTVASAIPSVVLTTVQRLLTSLLTISFYSKRSFFSVSPWKIEFQILRMPYILSHVQSPASFRWVALCGIPVLVIVLTTPFVHGFVTASMNYPAFAETRDDGSFLQRDALLRELVVFFNNLSIFGPQFPVAETDRESLDHFNIETSNFTVVLENLQLDGSLGDGPWMYSKSGDPFVQSNNKSNWVHASTHINWNPNALGNGSCESKGHGRPSKGYLDPFNYNLDLDRPENFFSIRASLDGLNLLNFTHINTLHPDLPWNTPGEASDLRRYVNGSFDIFDGNKTLLSTRRVYLLLNTSYPRPIGDSLRGPSFVSAYFVGQIVIYNSDNYWVEAIDPYGAGYVLGVVSAVSYQPQSCFSPCTLWVTIRGFPDLAIGTENSPVVQNNTSSLGAKVGKYGGSNETTIRRAQSLANVSVSVVSTVVSTAIAGAVTTTAVAIILPSAATAGVSVPGSGASKLIKNAAFVAKLSEIRGFHTDAMKEFGDGMKPFLLKFPFPFSPEEPSGVIRLIGTGWLHSIKLCLSGLGIKTIDPLWTARQDEDDDVSVTDEIFAGCALYTSVIVLGFLAIHFLIWIFTRKKPVIEQVTPHAWMVYLLSIVMSYVYTGSILNCFQYIRSHIGKGTGRPELYAAAVLELVFIDVGFLLFILVVMSLAIRRISRKDVKWIPREQHHDPAIRRSMVVVGEYDADESNFFHGVFESYYSGLAGPRIWLAAFEMIVTFLDAMFTAIIWNEIVCLGVLVGIHGLLFASFLLLGPFVDTIEGRLVMAVGSVDLILLFLEFLSALGDYDTAETAEGLVVILGFFSIAVATAITIYCDIIPISLVIWDWVREKTLTLLRKMKLVTTVAEEDWSEWSALNANFEGPSEENNEIMQRAATSTDNEARDKTRPYRLFLTGLFTPRHRTAQRAERWVRPNPPEEAMVQDTTHIVPGDTRDSGSHEFTAERPQWDRASRFVENVWDL